MADSKNQQPTRWNINGWEVPLGAILAPMAGVTDSAYRRIARRFGAGLLYSECISAEGLRRRGQTSLDFCRFEEEERPIALQIFGSRIEQLGEAAAVVAELYKPDLIDINCGCPVKKFVTKGCGGFLMQDPDMIGRMVEEVGKAGLPVSVKLRVGYWPGVETAPQAAIAAVQAGASIVALHGRFVRKAKGTPAAWDPIRRVREAIPNTPLFGNGDVFSYDDARRLIVETGCDRAMIARWAMGRPWLFAPMQDGNYPDIPPAELTITEKARLIEEQYGMMVALYGHKTAVFKMRKHFGWITHGWPEGARLRREVMLIPTVEGVMDRLRDYLANLDPDIDWSAIPQPIFASGEDDED